ncbi:hypothetical protein [Agrobacterium cavarae]|uniref:hypothetical protein n=1 Tax=Agrobacterium cavarae TaxID=2528239 RepID=UPI0028B16BFA|nr:hypothetical protein [Agrobacterium cavarae]
MPAFDEQAAINIANEYLNHPLRYPSDYDLEARDVVTKTTILLAKIAHSLSANALKKDADFFLVFAPVLNVWLACPSFRYGFRRFPSRDPVRRRGQDRY